MASSTSDDGVRFIHEADGSITAVDEATGAASFGDTKAEALRMLAEVLDLHNGRGTPIEDPDAFLREELGLEAPKESQDLPDFML